VLPCANGTFLDEQQQAAHELVELRLRAVEIQDELADRMLPAEMNGLLP
jgi:hypothetical protein